MLQEIRLDNSVCHCLKLGGQLQLHGSLASQVRVFAKLNMFYDTWPDYTAHRLPDS